MFIFGNLLRAVTTLLSIVLNLYLVCIFIRAVISWVNPDPYNFIVQTLNQITDPCLAFIRKKVPFSFVGAIDLSPFIACLIIIFLQSFLIKTLYQIAAMMR